MVQIRTAENLSFSDFSIETFIIFVENGIRPVGMDVLEGLLCICLYHIG